MRVAYLLVVGALALVLAGRLDDESSIARDTAAKLEREKRALVELGLARVADKARTPRRAWVECEVWNVYAREGAAVVFCVPVVLR